MDVHHARAEPWRITLVETGVDTMTGGRLKRVRDYLGDETFCMTYGDGVGDVDVRAAIRLHESKQKLATVTAVRPPARFGALEMKDGLVTGFQEKPIGDGGWINGGFFVLSPSVIDRIAGDTTTWEDAPLEGCRATASSPRTTIRVLAADGHAARQDPPRRPVAIRPGAVEDLVSPSPGSGAASGSCSPATRASRGLLGHWLVRLARRSAASRWRPIPNRACSARAASRRA